MKKIISLFLVLLLSFTLVSCSLVDIESGGPEEIPNKGGDSGKNIGEDLIREDQVYSSKEDVALYIDTYGKLPKNFIRKKEATDLGWEANKGNLWDVSDMMSIGGDRFGNREKLLPEKEGRQYYECDINYEGGYRGGERLVYSNDGLIYYTGDHYKTFSLLYGDES